MELDYKKTRTAQVWAIDESCPSIAYIMPEL
jgi:hypothetical protein